MTDTVRAYKDNAATLLKDPDDAMALVNQFVLLAGNSDRTPAHLALTSRAAKLAPTQFEPAFNHASALNRAGRFEEALAEFRRALVLAPASRRADVLYNIGMCWHDLGDLDAALGWYEKAIALREDLDIGQAHAVARLAQGKLSEGLFDFECRWHRPARKPIAESGIPRWQGEPLDGKTIVVAHEQGFGDTLQFCRFIPRLKAAKVIWSGPPVLNGLIVDHFGVDEVRTEAGPFEADYYCSPISAAGSLGIEYTDVSGAPYLRAEPMQLPDRGKLKVGLAWKGSKGYARDADRSMSLSDLCPLFDIPNTAFYSLQVPESKEVSALGLDGFIANLGSLIKDWRDTARAVAAMDLIVSVDTANAHLAGAMGKKVFLLLNAAPCWRWMRERADTPWYDSVRLFRQKVPGDWAGVVSDVREAIRNG